MRPEWTETGNGSRPMIVYDLQCAKSHVFEAWFRDGATYDRQVKRGTVACPVCGDKRVTKSPMAPKLASTKEKAKADAKLGDMLRGVREVIEKNFDHVGDRFPEEARKIHYGEAEKRNIYGEATLDEARELKGEGVEFGLLPWPKRQDS